MSSVAEAENVSNRARRGKLPCETPGCSEQCVHAYSCHEERTGGTKYLAWPVAGLAILFLIGLVL